MASNTFKGFVYGAVAAASYGLNPLFICLFMLME